MDLLVLVTGFPATGKTTLAEQIAPALRLPLIAKDTIKEALHRTLGAETVEDSNRLGLATYAVMFSLAASLREAMLEANFDPARAGEQIRRLHPAPIEVFVRCDPDEAVRRYRARDRGAPHFDAQRADALETRLRASGQEPLALGGPVLIVDTTDAVDTDTVIGWLREQLDRA